MASNQAVKVDVVDNKKNKGKKLADKSIRAFVDVEKVKNLIGGGGSGGGGQYVLELYTNLSTSSTIELASEDDGTVSDACLFGVNVADFIDFVTHGGSPYLHHNLLSSYNLVVIAIDAAADVDTCSSSVASVFARDSGETDPETWDPIQEFGILFTAYDSTNRRFKEYEGVLTESDGVWSITISEASFGHDNADNMES